MNACAACNTDKQARRRFVSCQNKTGILGTRLLADKPTLPYKRRRWMHTTTLTIGKEKTGISMQDTHASKLKRTHKHVKKPMHLRNKHRHFHTNKYTNWGVHTKWSCLKSRNKTGMGNKAFFFFLLHVLRFPYLPLMKSIAEKRADSPISQKTGSLNTKIRIWRCVYGT